MDDRSLVYLLSMDHVPYNGQVHLFLSIVEIIMSNPYSVPKQSQVEFSLPFRSCAIALLIGSSVFAFFKRGFDTSLVVGLAFAIPISALVFVVSVRTFERRKSLSAFVVYLLVFAICSSLFVTAESRHAFNTKTKNAVDRLRRMQEQKSNDQLNNQIITKDDLTNSR